MYVKYVVLDGFKSYREPVKIGPFDPHFNAITGLNGSGKSNILDGICFVLGITSMSVVRCKNLADCIYMGHGESLTKATVSIILDNQDKSRSPPNHKNYDEIIVSRTVMKGGDCRYHINRIHATKRAVTDLFQSVQLNVNNPNFMIMQGKITKVVNMKPKEILHMIEETVGATLYQAKREKAANELRSKQNTIESIESLICEHIKPSLDKQIKAFEMIQEYNVQNKEKAECAIDYAVAKYFDLQENSVRAKHELEKILDQDQKDDEEAEQYKAEIQQLKNREEQMKKENTSRFQENVDASEKNLKEHKKTLLKKENEVKTCSEALEKARKNVKDAVKSKAAEEKQVADFRKQSEKAVSEYEELKTKIRKAEEEIEGNKEKENQLRSGKLLDEEGKSMDVNEQLNSVSSEIAGLKPEVDDGRQRVTDYRRKLSELERQLKQTPSDDQMEREYNQKAQQLESLKREASKRNINADETVVEIQNRLQDTRRRLQASSQKRDQIWRGNTLLSLNYSKDRVPEGVYGLGYDCVTLRSVEEWGNALESAIRTFVFCVFVETDTIGRSLLKAVDRRISVNAFNTFKSGYREPRVTQAQLDNQFGPGNTVFASSLVDCDQKFIPFVQHYIGGKVLCKTMDIARKVAYQLHLQAYTTGGDFVDPGGIMQGGTTQNIGRLIRDCMELNEAGKGVKFCEQELRRLQNQLQLAQSNEQFIGQLDKAKRELHNAEQMRGMTKYSQLKAEIDSTKQKLEEDGGKLKEMETKYANLEKRRAQLQKQSDDAQNHRGKQMREITTRIQETGKELEALRKRHEDRKEFFEKIEVELNSKMAFLTDCQNDIDEANASVQEHEKKLADAHRELAEFQEEFNKVQEEFNEAVATSNEWHEEAKQIQDKIKALDKRKESSELNKMKRNNQRTQHQQYVQFAEGELEHLQAQHPSIDFANRQRPRGGKNAGTLKKELGAITKRLEDMQQRLDHEAANALPNTKREFAASTDKLSKIEKNKLGLEKAIRTLDKSKKDKVKAAYDDVNMKFNNMMQTLLPEARARLVEVVPGDLSQGVNIHVQLGGVWKESLTELSGGQRSLVALSLVLSLCMYNPAPFYILDEVDAALDLSHTQNIGVVIQRQFKGTQFICVSLKDGMFSNANVLFTAKHEGGRSVVQRSAKINRSMPPPSTDDRNQRKGRK